MLYSKPNEFLMRIRSIQVIIVVAVLGIGGVLLWRSSTDFLLKSNVIEGDSDTTQQPDGSTPADTSEPGGISTSDTSVSDSGASDLPSSSTSPSEASASTASPDNTSSSSSVPSASSSDELTPQQSPSSDPSPQEPLALSTDAPSVSSEPAVQEASSSSAQYKKELVNGSVEFSRYIAYREKVILDALLIPEKVAQLTTPVRWTPPEAIELDDAKSVKTYFIAPSDQKELVFRLEVLEGGQYNMAASFRFKVVSPQIIKADVNLDGNYDFTDLLNLLQHWQDFGTESTQIMSFILSQYRTAP